ncbi:TGF-beta-activated kinase 1 and MAP3K7-binding 1-like isoform X1 [Brachionus plicatilis]|uniref:TGF-beta-activated kinase 1 and MAP3K7-binding 1-like isoform X1 n=1 Tax=Brachionus plicatilis TaxID=10195 RepID=A0A3M7SQD6_BRAPC|nr:TGF-beta-activated kinase 1 and MAP3K7-binding 1-like isoform X1 [Brachionus plicatilis]
MNFYSLENLTKKYSKWTDAIKRDSKYCGIGTVNNRVKIQHGQILEQPCEDRSFSFELKDGEIYAYAVIDGFNGTWVVDFLEQFLLSNLYFDHLSDLSIKSNEEINDLLIKEFFDAERYLSEQSQETLAKRASINIHLANLNKRCPEYAEKIEELKMLNDDLTIGAYAVVSLIVNDRLFVTNLGTSHCFVCVYDKSNREKKVITLETEHSLRNLSEIQRLINLKADVKEYDYDSSPSIKHSRCFGDFYSKYFFYENPQFDTVTKNYFYIRTQFYN